MHRRAFLSLLASGLVGASVDVDRLLWVPGKKTIFLPPPPRIHLPDPGISIRFIKDYDVRTGQSPARLDILYGWKAIRPDMAVRIAS